ncbi:hypothetical protein QV65_13240 [Rhodococcus erythropolis]|nr:hypothetical protein QV65_13240 [Rhodococcus erythropolis]
MEWEDDTPVLKDNELLEVSCVPIPANANAVALALKDGSLNTKDAQWMLRSMRDGAAELQEQLNKNKPEEGEEKHVEEVKTQLKDLSDLIVNLGEQFSALDTKIETVSGELTEVKSTVAELKPVETNGSTEQGQPAKGGEDDQPGAGEDEFDEDAELTPELQAQIDEEFASESQQQ